jgi:hypothetical protein
MKTFGNIILGIEERLEKTLLASTLEMAIS